MFHKIKGKYLLIYLVITATLMGFNKIEPKVFVIGDSISMHYGPFLKNSLDGFMRYDRKRDNGKSSADLDHPAGANGGDSRMVVSYLKELSIDSTFSTDYLLVNCGLHDIKTNTKTGKKAIPAKEYEHNLKEIIDLSHKMKVHLVWVNTTPVVDSIHNSRMPAFHRYNKDVLKYNKIARNIMDQAGVPVIDLYQFTSKFIPEGYHDHVHYKEEIREKQADFIAGNLVQITQENSRD